MRLSKRCGLLGRKLGHSYSPMIHDAFNLGYSYEIFEKEPEELPEFLQNGNFHGVNVTIPYKKDVIPFCSELSQTARAIGSVNTLLRLPGGGLFGDNTDGYGFLAMLEHSGIDVSGKKVLILGSGGSCLTVCSVLKQQNAGEVIVVSRDGENNYSNLHKHSDAQVIVNTTPVGMYPNVGESSVAIEIFPKLEGILDLIYNPAKTKLILNANARGITCINGLIMLIGQAAAAAKIFAGTDNPPELQNARAMIRKNTENIILIGMPGCGKTTVGKILAQKLNKNFIDADAEIESDAGRVIPDIFQSEGEKGFRIRESAVLQEFGKQSNLVISTGGGCVTREENFNYLSQNGMIVFLERDIDSLEKKDRPLSKAMNLHDMYKIRQPLYKSFANAVISNNTQPEETAEKIKEVFCHEITNN